MSTRYLFLDTETTGFVEAQLLSIALVGLDGEELYLELDLTQVAATSAEESRLRNANAFVTSTVLPQFGKIAGAGSSIASISERLVDWLQGLAPNKDDELHICYDWSKDYDLFEEAVLNNALKFRTQLDELVNPRELLGKLNPCFMGVLNADPTAEAARQCVRERFEAIGLGRHHALVDAWGLAAAYQAQSTNEPLCIARLL